MDRVTLFHANSIDHISLHMQRLITRQ